ncbi:hypothetical protein [Deinococcus hopiensis]|uniref:Uncharacterized protein n=1 Tax=Deinococcus hopiensis KR-140 TaxID=695939 RepID=A0A1W1V6C2_9DEIO|nr:hypothetical protein [Deinococcus hopiensis]SMB88928.1 hypothetical protein SAMN00790413_00221 [Deinococcus hopiensis KR-140]
MKAERQCKIYSKKNLIGAQPKANCPYYIHPDFKPHAHAFSKALPIAFGISTTSETIISTWKSGENLRALWFVSAQPRGTYPTNMRRAPLNDSLVNTVTDSLEGASQQIRGHPWRIFGLEIQVREEAVQLLLVLLDRLWPSKKTGVPSEEPLSSGFDDSKRPDSMNDWGRI